MGYSSPLPLPIMKLLKEWIESIHKSSTIAKFLHDDLWLDWTKAQRGKPNDQQNLLPIMR